MGIFARELQIVLENHQDSLSPMWQGRGPLTDQIWYPLRRLAIAPEVINRLKEAARSDEKRATLNPEAFELVCSELNFTSAERTRLRAALLAQGVEMFLRDRMKLLEESVISAISKITESVFEQLNANFQPIYNQARGGGEIGDDLEVMMQLLDRADSFKHAELDAIENGTQEAVAFWRRVTDAAYTAVLEMLTTDYTDLATEIQKGLKRL